jgi:hypothetical protein
VRSIWHELLDDRSRRAVEVAELHADGLATADEFIAAREAALQAWPTVPEPVRPLHRAAQKAAGWDPLGAAEDAAREIRRVKKADARRRQSDLLRCIFGNPFRKVAVQAAWLRWNDRTVARMAQRIYDERRFEDLPILHDALLDAGCDDANMLSHAREQVAVHTRGCWLLDLLLNKD